MDKMKKSIAAQLANQPQLDRIEAKLDKLLALQSKPEAHAYPLEEGYRKPAKTVTNADIFAVKALLSNGKLNQKQIAAKVDLSEAVISKIKAGEYDNGRTGWGY